MSTLPEEVRGRTGARRGWQYDQRESVRRTDARWRTRYPHIDTEIYEFDLDDHSIYVPPEQIRLADVEEDFNHSVRMVADRVRMVDVRPNDAVRIDSITDSHWAADLGGLSLTVHDLRVLIAGRFPTAPLLSSSQPSGDGFLDVSFEAELPRHVESDILRLVTDHGRGMQARLAPAAAVEPRRDTGNGEAMTFQPVRLRGAVPSFVAEDEEWWFNNAAKIYAGAIGTDAFEFRQGAGMACYVQAAVMPQVDLRQLLLAYDTIFLEPPIKLEHPIEAPDFWSSQRITRDDLLQLVASDRVRLILSQPEERGDLGFLAEAKRLNPNGVLSRRRTAALFASHLVEVDDWYLLSDLKLRIEVREVIGRLRDEFGEPEEQAAAWVLYPSMARRSSFSYLFDRGLAGLAGFGQGRVFGDLLMNATGKDGRLEASTFGADVEVARMLHATYIPPTGADYIPSWYEPMRLIGDRLNFYASFRRGVSAQWATNERAKRDPTRTILPPIPLIEFNKHATIADILELTGGKPDRRKWNALIARLAELDEEERGEEVERISKELYRHQLAKRRWARGRKVLDLGANVVTGSTGLPVAQILSGWGLLNTILELARRAPVLDSIVDTIEESIAEKIGANQELSFLSSVSPIAEIRQE